MGRTKVFPLATAYPMTCFRKGQTVTTRPIGMGRIAAMVKMEVGKHHIRHLIRRDTQRGKCLLQIYLVEKRIVAQLLQMLLAGTCVDQHHTTIIQLHHQGAHGQHTPIPLVRRIASHPSTFGNGSEHGPTVCIKIACINPSYFHTFYIFRQMYD